MELSDCRSLKKKKKTRVPRQCPGNSKYNWNFGLSLQILTKGGISLNKENENPSLQGEFSDRIRNGRDNVSRVLQSLLTLIQISIFRKIILHFGVAIILFAKVL